MSQLPADCLNEIFEYFGECNDKATLRSCLLVNRLWCEVSVRILWRNNWNYSTLIACLPTESKEILYSNSIIIPAPTSKPLMFNYVAFCKDISSHDLRKKINALFKNQPSISSQSLDNNTCIIAQEILKMFMNKTTSLRKLDVRWSIGCQNITFVTYPGANDCLSNISELICCSDEFYPGFFNQLSQICHDIKSLEITFEDDISNGLTDLILSQNNLKYLLLRQHQESYAIMTNIIPSLTKLSNTLIKLQLDDMCDYLPTISGLTNLHEFELSFQYDEFYDDGFSELEYVIFPQLEILRLKCAFSDADFLVRFLENNGKNLKEICIKGVNGFNSSIAEHCPNLKILTTCIKPDDLDILKEIFNNCQHLESFTAIYDDYEDEYLNENQLLDIVAKYSPESFYELTLSYRSGVEPVLFPEELESFFKSWTNRAIQKSISLFIKTSYYVDNNLNKNEENMKIIGKYSELGVIRKCKFIDY